jgi:hypothetical protein
VATLTIDGQRMDMRLEKSVPADSGHSGRLESVMSRRLA